MTTLVIAMTLAGLAGILLAPMLSRNPRLGEHCTAFAAGVLIAVVITHVIPEAVVNRPHVGGGLVLLGFIAMMLLQQKVLRADPCCGHDHARKAFLPSYLSMVACSINDGVILQEIPGLGEPLFWAMAGHKITASFALVVLLRETRSELSERLQWIYLIGFVLITPAVLLLASSLGVVKPYMPFVVAVGAGALLYVICSGLVPRVEHLAQDGKNRVLGTFLVATAISVVVELWAPHHHHDHHHHGDGHSHEREDKK